MDSAYSESAYTDDDLNDLTSEDIELRGSRQDDGPQSTFANTAFDAYFALNHKPSRTSNNVFSNLLIPLTAQEYSSATEPLKTAQILQVPWLDNRSQRRLFPRLLFELEQGYNLLFYGVGSKRVVLNTLAARLNEEDCDVLVVNAFNPSFTIKDLLTSIESLPDMQSFSLPPIANVDGQAKRILKYFNSPDTGRDLYITIHNIDAPTLRNAKARSALAALASHPRIHVLASVDNIAFASLWTFSDIFRRNHDQRGRTPNSTSLASPGYGWLFHDLTTLDPYDFETTYADRSSCSGASQATKSSRAQKDVPGISPTTIMTEDAARHILLSVTQKAKKLFVLLGTRQLEAIGNLDASKIDPKSLAFDYGMLFKMARDDFVASNDTALRALMGEFKDHGLVVSVTQITTGAEAVWIPLRKEALLKVVDDLKREQS